MSSIADSVEVPDHELIRRISRGSYGEVWLARNIMGQFRAVKVVYQWFRKFLHTNTMSAANPRSFESYPSYRTAERSMLSCSF